MPAQVRAEIFVLVSAHRTRHLASGSPCPSCSQRNNGVGIRSFLCLGRGDCMPSGRCDDERCARQYTWSVCGYIATAATAAAAAAATAVLTVLSRPQYPLTAIMCCDGCNVVRWIMLSCRRRAPRKLQEAANLSEGDSDYDPAVSSDGDSSGGVGNGGRRKTRGTPAARKQVPPALSQPPRHWQPHLTGGHASLR